MTDHFVLVPPESPVLNGGDWLDLGTMECPSKDHAYDTADALQNGDCPCWPSGRVPVVPTWTCPTCDGFGTRTVAENGNRPIVVLCRNCNGEGVVSQGWLALGAAGGAPHRLSSEYVPASLSELVRVQRVPVMVHGRLPEGDTSYLKVSDSGSVYLTEFQGRHHLGGLGGRDGARMWGMPEDITDQFPSPPNPGDLVWRIVERVTLSEPITRVPCSACSVTAEWCGYEGPGAPEPPNPNCSAGTVTLPQQVGWYQADDALVAEIERWRP